MTMNDRARRTGCHVVGRAIAASLLLALTAGSARAQEQVLDEVIVTARKRVENVQIVPITISVMSGEVLDDFSVRNANDLADAVPGLVIQETPQNLSQVTVRGLGTGAGGESLDQSVGLFIDGIWAGRIREFQAALFDMERIEVIKGSQNTLLGKNTSLGAISILSRRPEDELGGYLQGDYELEFGSTYLNGALNVPTDFGDYRIAVNFVNEDGYVDNDATGNEVPTREQSTIRTSALYDVSDNGNLLLSYQYDDLSTQGDAFQPDNDAVGFLAGMANDADIGIDDSKDGWSSYSASGDPEDDQDSRRAMARFQYDFGEYQFTSLSGWTRYDNERSVDSDFLSVDYINTAYDSDNEQYSQEFRIVSPVDQRIEYILGVYYLNASMNYSAITDLRFPHDSPDYTIAGLPLDGASQLDYDQDTEVWSSFGQGTLHLGGRWSSTLGLRYTSEEKDAHWARHRTRSGGPLADIVANLLAPEVARTPLTRSEDSLDGSINVQYDVRDDVMGYLSWARGSKSGGFTTEVALPEDAEFDTEQAETMELGVKMDLAGGAAQLNAAAFQTEINDFQIISFVGLGFLTETVPAKTQGVEMEALWAATERLTLDGSAIYSDATEDDTGERLPYAPRWSSALHARYEHPWTGANLQWRIDGILNYRDKQYMQRGERSPDGPLTLFDLRIALAAADDRWEVALMGRNLLDQKTSFGFDFPVFGGRTIPEGAATIGSLNRPRTIAVQARYAM
jgi:iron complex outermembrane recepter protein